MFSYKCLNVFVLSISGYGVDVIQNVVREVIFRQITFLISVLQILALQMFSLVGNKHLVLFLSIVLVALQNILSQTNLIKSINIKFYVDLIYVVITP